MRDHIAILEETAERAAIAELEGGFSQAEAAFIACWCSNRRHEPSKETAQAFLVSLPNVLELNRLLEESVKSPT